MRALLFSLVLGLSVAPVHSFAQEPLDQQAILKETQRLIQHDGKLVFIWWIPEQYWQATLEMNANVSKVQRKQFLDIVRRYSMVAVAQGKVGPMGGFTYPSAEAVRSTVNVKDAKGAIYLPLGDAEVDADMKNLLQILIPVIGNALGQFGQNTNFLLFRSRDGGSVVDPAKPGVFEIDAAGEVFRFRLPLGSLLPAKYDSQSGEKFPGNFDFSPYTGEKLVASPPTPPPN